MKTVKAQIKYLHIAPRKTRFLVDLIRGLPLKEAEAQLMISSRRSSNEILKLLRSAESNAKQQKYDPETLFIKEIFVGNGPMYKRWTPRARGSAATIRKRTCHISVILGVSESKRKTKFIIHEKPKKKKEDKKQKPKKENKEKTEKVVGEKKQISSSDQKSKRRFFRRKSV